MTPAGGDGTGLAEAHPDDMLPWVRDRGGSRCSDAAYQTLWVHQRRCLRSVRHDDHALGVSPWSTARWRRWPGQLLRLNSQTSPAEPSFGWVIKALFWALSQPASSGVLFSFVSSRDALATQAPKNLSTSVNTTE